MRKEMQYFTMLNNVTFKIIIYYKSILVYEYLISMHNFFKNILLLKLTSPNKTCNSI